MSRAHNTREYFSARYQPDANGCWIWTAKRSLTGYGRARTRNPERELLAHRLSWELANGSIPDGLMVCHRCDVRLCVNPDHLFLGTAKDNTRDMMSKGRETFTPNLSRAIERRRSRTHCKFGHPFDEANTYTSRDSRGRLSRVCRACRVRRYKARVQQEAA